MTQTINRMFDSAETANTVLDDLKNSNLRDAYLVSPQDDDTLDLVVDKIMKSMVWKPHARVLAKGVLEGGSLVTVHAPFGRAREALELMAAHAPIESGLPDQTYPSMPWDERIPFSSALQWPVTAKTKLPISVILNVPAVLKRPVNISALLGLPMLSPGKTPLSSKFGLQILSPNATPLSSTFGLALLSADKVPK